ncbi:MAG TPA: endonuclease III, partial [Myxococcota bacterium]
AAPPRRLEALIRRTGFFNQKSKALRACARDVIERFGGEVPSALDDLVTMKGVGRKTASVVVGTAFGQPAVFVDTHVARLSRRLGLTTEEVPDRIESDLKALLEPAEWTSFCHRLIHHGRRVCHARVPSCPQCPVADLCPRIGVDAAATRKRSRIY